MLQKYHNGGSLVTSFRVCVLCHMIRGQKQQKSTKIWGKTAKATTKVTLKEPPKSRFEVLRCSAMFNDYETLYFFPNFLVNMEPFYTYHREITMDPERFTL